MSIYHKHKGVLSNGKLKSHPVERVHSDANVQKWHNLSLGANKAIETRNKPLQQAKQEVIQNIRTQKENVVFCAIDRSGYVNVDLEDTPNNVNGLRVKFTRTENRTKRTVALQIDK